MELRTVQGITPEGERITFLAGDNDSHDCKLDTKGFCVCNQGIERDDDNN